MRKGWVGGVLKDFFGWGLKVGLSGNGIWIKELGRRIEG
jgi:hypothetical protein